MATTVDSTTVDMTQDPAEALAAAADFLSGDPVRHNLVLTLLHGRIRHPEPGRYWTARRGGRVVATVMQSPLDFMATMTPMADDVVPDVVDPIAAGGIALPGAHGEAATVARFAGCWTERTRTAARPVLGQRLYELAGPPVHPGVGGRLRQAGDDDAEVATEWFTAFKEETGDGGDDIAGVVARRLRAGQLWLWDDGGPRALAGVSEPVAGVVRIGPVYTPPDRRGRGYGSAVTAGVAAFSREAGLRCCLYTDLGNPTSNSIYRAIGFAAVSEALRYAFEPATPAIER
ncbi:MAG TPA: GNAT family N-acetyltransferase [Acidimicrobiales bacterium]|nr:GNAT family N-acetyltransferase [Acidimicrobiales bacterium]